MKSTIITIGIAVVLISGGSYYKFVYKPAQIRAECEAILIRSLDGSIQSLREKGIVISADQEDQYRKQYMEPIATDCGNSASKILRN